MAPAPSLLILSKPASIGVPSLIAEETNRIGGIYLTNVPVPYEKFA